MGNVRLFAMNETQKSSSLVAAKATEIKDMYLAEIAKHPNLKVQASHSHDRWNIRVSSTDEKYGAGWWDNLFVEIVKEHWNALYHLDVERRAGGKKRHYKNYDVATLRKIAEDASELEKRDIIAAKQREAASNVTGQWQATRHLLLKGVVISPSIKVSIVEKPEEPTSADEQEAKFLIDFERYGTSPIHSYQFTRDQVVRLCTILAEITGVDKAYALIRRDEDGVRHYDGTYFAIPQRINQSPRAKPYPSREAAEAVRATLSEANRKGTEIILYSRINL